MYTKWARKQGYGGRIVEKCVLKKGGIKSATIEFESKYAYGYLSGERGVHRIIKGSRNESMSPEVQVPSLSLSLVLFYLYSHGFRCLNAYDFSFFMAPVRPFSVVYCVSFFSLPFDSLFAF